MTGLPDQVASIHIAVPVERVWAEITKTGRVQRPMFGTVLESELAPGSRLRYYSPDKKRVFVVGEVLEVRPPTRLVHTYWFTTWKAGGPTRVTWDLAPEGEGCRVTITHSGWTEAHAESESTGKGWRSILELLKAELETGRLPLGARVKLALMNRLAFLLPKTTTTGHADAQGW